MHGGQPSTPVSIIGAGSWGTALATILARKGLSVRLWAYEREICEAITRTRENPVFLPGIRVPDNVKVFNEFAAVLEGSNIVLTVMPSHVCRRTMEQLSVLLSADALIVSATKGLEDGTLMRMSQVIAEILGGREEPARIGALSGPTFAREVARGDPTALVIASRDMQLVTTIQQTFSGPTFRVYASSDIAGVEYAASLKNVIAIAAGICAGLGLGSNSIAALITRGLAEIGRLAERCGGRRETLAGLAGLGDLVLTCTGTLSRNRTVGVELGKGQKLADILGSTPMVAEGVKTTAAAMELARRNSVEMPIVEQMHRVLFENAEPRDAIRALMDRPLKFES